MLRARRFTALALAPAVLALATLPGCIAVIDAGPDDAHVVSGSWGSARRVRLTSDERATLPKVTTLADLPTIESKYSAELRRLTPSTTLDEFKGLFPTARFVERREIQGQAVDAYAVKLEEKYRYSGHDYGYLARDERWFFFRDNLFMKTAAPSEWP